MSRISNQVILSIGLTVVAVGFLDALLSREWDLLTVFALSGIIQIVLWMRETATRLPCTLRPDLAHWIERRAALVGEPATTVLDRSVAHYKHRLYVGSSAGD